MAAAVFLALLLLTIIQQPQSVSDGLEETTLKRTRQREEYLRWKMTQLLREIEQMEQRTQEHQEQRSQEQGAFAWRDLLLAALQQWQLWAVAGLLVLLAGLCWWCRKRSRQPDIDDEEESSSNDVENSGSDEGESSGSITEQEEEEGEDSDEEADLIRNFTNRVEQAVRSEANRSREVEELVGDLLSVLQEHLSNSFFPLPQPAIRVGSTFEGWHPHGDDAVYHLLVPLQPPMDTPSSWTGPP